MRLWHFTCPGHLLTIKETGYLKLVESNIGSPDPKLRPYGEHVGPDVVWAFDNPNPNLGDPRQLNGQLPYVANKQLVRIEFDVPQRVTKTWDRFARRHHINPTWRNVLELVGGADHWVVVERVVGINEFTEIVIRDDVESPWVEVVREEA